MLIKKVLFFLAIASLAFAEYQKGFSFRLRGTDTNAWDEAISKRNFIQGIYWWIWDEKSAFTPYGKPAKEVVAKWYSR